MKIYRQAAFTFGLLILLAACLKKEEFKKFEFQDLEPAWGVPLIDSKVTLKNIVAAIDTGVGLREETDGSYTFYYYDTISSPVMEDLFKLPDQAFHIGVGSPVVNPATFPFPAGTTLKSGFNGEQSIVLANNGQLKYAILKGGNISLNISNTFKHKVDLKITVPSLLDAQQKELVKSYTLSPSQNTLQDNIGLAGYKLQLTSGSTNQTNSFQYRIDYIITSSGNAALNPADSVSIAIGLQNLKYSLIVGDLGAINFPPYAGVIDLGVFEQTSLGNLHFEEAKLHLAFNNSIGIPVALTINKLKSTTAYGKEVNITPNQFTVKIAAPSLSGPGTSKRTDTTLSKDNSGIVDAVNPAPNKLDYDFSSSLSSGTDNFIRDNSQIKVYARIDIPIKGYIKSFEIKDTLASKSLPERTFTSDNADGSLDSAVFKIRIENSLPANAYTQLYFLDSNYAIIDSLLLKPDDIIASNHVDPVTGIVLSPTVKDNTVSMSGSRYDKIRARESYFYIYSRVTTPSANGQPINVKLLSSNSMRVLVSVLVKARIKIK